MHILSVNTYILGADMYT